MSSTYNPSAVFIPSLTLPDDGDPRAVATINPAIATLADQVKHVTDRRLPYVINSTRNRPVDAIVNVPTGSTVKVHTAGANLFATYAQGTFAVLITAVLDLRNATGGAVQCDVILGATANAIDLDQLTQTWDVPASNIPQTAVICAWLAMPGGIPVSTIGVYAKIQNGSSATISVLNSSLSGLILKNTGA